VQHHTHKHTCMYINHLPVKVLCLPVDVLYVRAPASNRPTCLLHPSSQADLIAGFLAALLAQVSSSSLLLFPSFHSSFLLAFPLHSRGLDLIILPIMQRAAGGVCWLGVPREYVAEGRQAHGGRGGRRGFRVRLLHPRQASVHHFETPFSHRGRW
jgi:hypothetical protein